MKNYKRLDYKKYDAKDSSNVFLWAIFAPYMAFIFMIFALNTFENIFDFFNLEIDIDLLSTMINMVIVQAAFIALFLIYNKIKKIDWPRAIKLNKIDVNTVVVSIIIGIISLIFFYPLINIFEYVNYQIGFSIGDLTGRLGIDFSTLSGYLIGVFAVAVLPAIGEELLFRGVVFNGINTVFGYKSAMFLSAAAFSLIHMSPFQTVYPFILGIILAYIVYKTASIIPAIIIHFVNNFLVLTISFVSTNLFDQGVENGEYVPTISFFLIFNALVMSIIGFFIIKALINSVSNNNSKFETSSWINTNLHQIENIINIERYDDLKNKGIDQLSLYDKVHTKKKYKKSLLIAFTVATITWSLSLFLYL